LAFDHEKRECRAAEAVTTPRATAGFAIPSAGIAIACLHLMASGWNGREQRRSPRIDVRLRVQGRLLDLNIPVLVHDLSRTGFAVVSEDPFEPGQQMDFQLTGRDGTILRVTAEAVHNRALTENRRGHLSGFKFIPGRLTGLLPQTKIDRLIAAISSAGTRFFDTLPRGGRTVL
jgi:hypothetical protein